MLIIALFLLQTGRRNLTKSQLVKAYSRVEAQLAEEAKARMLSGKKNPASNLTEGKEKMPETAETVAKKVGVSKNTYKAMKQIVSEGTKEQIERMDKGGKWSMVISSRTMRHGRQKYNEKQREKGYLLATFLLALDKKHEKQQKIIGRKTLAK